MFTPFVLFAAKIVKVAQKSKQKDDFFVLCRKNSIFVFDGK